jgi:hypothetical protein
MTDVHITALVVFCVFFALVTIAGFWAAPWRRPMAGRWDCIIEVEKSGRRT